MSIRKQLVIYSALKTRASVGCSAEKCPELPCSSFVTTEQHIGIMTLPGRADETRFDLGTQLVSLLEIKQCDTRDQNQIEESQ